MAYESPIHVYTTEIRQKISEECDRIVFGEIKKVGVYVEKDELIKALEYDRDQYQKGFRDGRLSIERETGKWIPVTERLPNKFQSIFAACKSEGRENWTINTVYDPFLKCPWGPIPILETGNAVVYAWMDNSTPEPPEEE